MDYKNIISKIVFPTSNCYFESDSSDGFAFLGYARAFFGLDYNNCLNAIQEKKYRLGAATKIKKINVSKHNLYTYTLWPCTEFLRLTGQHNKVDNLMLSLDSIGTYSNGLMRYCSEEIDYIVPNASSCAIYMYTLYGKRDLAFSIVNALKSVFHNGNWWYSNKNGLLKYKEDSFHLAMIVYHLRESNRLFGMGLEKIIESCVLELQKMNNKSLSGGSIGWGIPMLYPAVVGIDDDLANRAKEKILKESINNKNFRTRAYAAWSITKMK